ncbi:helix-turn-helix domain-containing protein [uncultured Chryseobacterium sp.]|uniref:XRE family transcriptional regulator n=1 Tax=uncultured Chryseobacterium sp. TaxID=259322 RepID=UPI00260DF965|nr:helix-turn-helix domain-containing protein [uncultured Chryseobacterium sp.]
MSVLADNMRYLRAKLNLSQQKVADSLLITRGRYAKYEDGASEPPIMMLMKISKYYKISIDLLVSVDVRKYSLDEIIKLPDNRIVLPIKVDSYGENKIEIIPHRAQMGYLSGYSDPEYIEGLQTISLPFLRNGKYRAFPASGDSMPPYNDGTFIVGKYIENKDDLKTGKTYIFITRNDGIVYKRYAQKGKAGSIVSSDNQFYAPYEIEWDNVLEIWEFACSINTEEIEPVSFEYRNIKSMFEELRKEIKSISK